MERGAKGAVAGFTLRVLEMLFRSCHLASKAHFLPLISAASGIMMSPLTQKKLNTYVYVCKFVCVYIHIYLCMYIRMYVHASGHIHI